jgi:predicted CXXCH cytochrome family protein
MSGALSSIDPPGLELVIPALLLLIAVLPFLRQANRWQMVGLVALPLVLTAGLGYVKHTLDSRNESSRAALLAATPAQSRLRPVTEPNNAYASSKTCRACHPSEYNSWHNSYHRTMTQLAKPEAVLAKWHGIGLALGQATLQLEQKRDEFWVNTLGADGIKTGSQRVTMTTGSHHLQVYWTADAKGNLQHPFPYGWLIADQKWVPVQDTFLRDPHLTPPDAKWNNTCIKCHAVAGRPGVDPRTRTVNTTTAQLGISCEACHGPAGAHIAHYQNPANRYATHLGKKPAHAILNPGSEKLDHRLSAQVCGQCHSYQSQSQTQKIDWNKNGPRFLPGQNLKPLIAVVHASNFIADKNPSTPAGLKAFVATHKHLPLSKGDLLDRFWPDGMVRVTGREYNGLLDTACYQRGKMSCLSCHSMHGYHDKNDQLTPRMETNEACFQCHDDLRENLPAHSHHAVDSTGSFCYNCHMPHTTYGLLSGIRSHQIDSPSVETQLKTGRPNACNLCHLNQALDWTNQHLARWYGHRQPKLDNDDKAISSMLKMLLKGDAGQRAIVAWHMGWEPAREASGGRWQAGWLLHAMDDPYAAVRAIAHKALMADPEFANTSFDYTASLAKRTQQINTAKAAWLNGKPHGIAQQFELLLDDQGKPLKDAADRLTRQRDNRPMTLQE